MSNEDYKLNPDSNIYISIAEGVVLKVLGRKEEKDHGSSRITYGSGEIWRDEYGAEVPLNFLAPLRDLLPVRRLRFSIPLWLRVNPHTDARKTLKGEYKIRRHDKPDVQVIIPRNESRLVDKYLDLLI